MEELSGHAHDLVVPILGVVKKKGHLNFFKSFNKINIWSLQSRLGKIYISDGDLGQKFKRSETPYIENIPSELMKSINEGDILLATPDGKLKRIFDVASTHNCIFVTSRCNLKCIMCPQLPSSEPDPPIDQQIDLIKYISWNKPQHLAITGGEPTLLGDKLITLIKICKSYLPNTVLTILTNGRKLENFAFVKAIAEIQHPNLQFAIPLYSDDYSLHDEIVGVQGSFFDTFKGLHNLGLFGFQTEIRTVVLPQNASRLHRLAEFIYRNLTFVQHIAFMGLEVTGMARQNAAQLWRDPSEYSQDLVRAFQYMKRVDMPASIYNFQLCTLPEILWPFCRKSISDWKNYYIDECIGCTKKEACGGFFTTSGEYISKNIHRIN